MPPSPFSTLPPELICRVFESLDDFTTVSALARISRTFYSTWRSYPASITQAVAPHVFTTNLADALRLLDAQEEAAAESEAQTTSQLPTDQKQPSITRAKRLLANARCAAAATEEWVLNSDFNAYFEREVRLHEILRFERAFYRVWAVGVWGVSPGLQHKASDFLHTCSPRELRRLEELADYSYGYTRNEFGDVGLDFNDATWAVGRELVARRWREVRVDRWWGNMYVPTKDSFVGFYVFYDEMQKYLDRIPDEVDSTHWD